LLHITNCQKRKISYYLIYLLYILWVLRFPKVAANEQGLGAGGASTAARTGAKLANLHKLSGEPLPRLRQTQVKRWHCKSLIFFV